VHSGAPLRHWLACLLQGRCCLSAKQLDNLALGTTLTTLCPAMYSHGPLACAEVRGLHEHCPASLATTGKITPGCGACISSLLSLTQGGATVNGAVFSRIGNACFQCRIYADGSVRACNVDPTLEAIERNTPDCTHSVGGQRASQHAEVCDRMYRLECISATQSKECCSACTSAPASGRQPIKAFGRPQQPLYRQMLVRQVLCHCRLTSVPITTPGGGGQQKSRWMDGITITAGRVY
jgi:hypothetical protein